MAGGAVVGIIIVIILLILCVGVICTLSWWKRFLGRCLQKDDPNQVPNAVYEEGSQGPPTFRTLDPSALGRQRLRNDSTTIEPLPSLNQLNIDPRDSFELRRAIFPEGIVLAEGETNIYAHDWFHTPRESFPRTNLDYINVIGKGWFGKVIEAEATNISPITKKKKVIVRQMRDDASDEEQMRFLNQCRVYRDSGHANILKLLGFAVEKCPYITIFEYWPLGDLKAYLISQEKCGEAESLVLQGVISRMAIDIAKALEYLLSAGFIHEDLSARNCLVANVAGKIILGEYGLSCNKFPRDYYKMSNQVIPIRWAAPETLEFKDDTCKKLQITNFANIWSFGVVLWELYEFGKMPYQHLVDEEVISRVLVSKSFIMEPPNFPYVQDSTKDRLYKLMLSCWNSIPENRPTLQQILHVLSTH